MKKLIIITPILFLLLAACSPAQDTYQMEVEDQVDTNQTDALDGSQDETTSEEDLTELFGEEAELE